MADLMCHVVNWIWKTGPKDLVEICIRTGLKLSVVQKLMDELEDMGILEQGEDEKYDLC